MSDGRCDHYRITEQHHQKILALRHALAYYSWTAAVEDFADRGFWQRALVWIFMFIARPMCIIFWENCFASMISAGTFCYASFHREQFSPSEIAFLIFVSLFFLTPVLYFFVSDIHIRLLVIKDITDEEEMFKKLKMAETMDDLLKPLQASSIAIIGAIGIGFLFIR